MLDLKAQLAAAGLVTAEQVKAFDEREAKAKEAKLAKEKARRERTERNQERNRDRSRKPRGVHGNDHGHDKRATGPQQPRRGKGRTSVEQLKKLSKGQAYERMRKIVDHSRLDDKERTIPLPDDQTFNFVTASGRIGKLYLTEKTVQTLKDGSSAISAFMSNHGLSHCVLPKDIAVEFAEVFPFWLRHLRGHEPIIEAPEARRDSAPEAPEAHRDSAPEAPEAPEAPAHAAHKTEDR